MPTSRQLAKRYKIKNKPADSSDELEVSKVTRIVKLEPVMPPTFRSYPAPAGPLFTAAILSTSHRLLSPLSSSLSTTTSRHLLSSSLPPIASSSCLSTPSLFEAHRMSSSSLFPSAPSLYFGHSSASLLSSLASAGSSFSIPINFLDEKDKHD
ncbi:hypothetical protein B0H14DRAFT_3510641 [Mycena olivaceomarginata]|nr:hypothetical protein B0H14DRAFT_3510641 [Mycena olivaceomarginata]